MKLIKRLGTRLNKNGTKESWGEFYCGVCENCVERQLTSGKIAKSCGCNRNITHGGKGTRLYNIWNGIKTRCLNPNNKGYKHYGGRGITICNEWLDFNHFRDWALNNGYVDNLEIDRKETDGNYEPSNCQWITHEENMRKTRHCKIESLKQANEIRYLHKIGHTQKELAIKYNVSIATVNLIINNKQWR